MKLEFLIINKNSVPNVGIVMILPISVTLSIVGNVS